MRCTQPGCPGHIVDGYCDVCGMPAPAGASVPAQAAHASPIGRPTASPVPPAAVSTGVRPGPAQARPTPVSGGVPPLDRSGSATGRFLTASAAAAPSPTQSSGTGPRCQVPGCPGHIVDGYCDTCGAPASQPQASTASTAGLATMSLGSSRLRGGMAVRRPSVANHNLAHLGAGYTTIPPEPTVDPKSAILAHPEVPEDRRFCPNCGAEVGRSTKDSPGRLEGYCPACRKPYSFTPKLQPGDVVAGQYKVSGCLAHGGMGWLYLAQDQNVSDRWVVLKGLLNAGDEASMQAAMAEQRFLAQIQHPLIVEIYNFVTFEGGAYIVMEFVGGRSIKQILKDRMAKAGGVYDPLPVAQALAYIVEILPAFSYLHARGLLYCDFKPDNLMHVEDSVKLIDMGGVRRIDDDDSVIFGTVGFQAPEVATQGCSVASDIYTIGRTLLICCDEVKGYQSTYATTLPPAESLPHLAHQDSVYRLIAKACAPDPSDRFASVEELREQMLGVLREVASVSRGAGAQTATPSDLFEPPTVVSDAFTWKHLPRLKPDLSDPGLVTLGSLDPALSPQDRLAALLRLPVRTLQTDITVALTAIDVGAKDVLARTVESILTRDPWQWRAAWIEGLSGLNTGDWAQAQACFNAVYSQVPGELAPKFALAVACEMGGVVDVAERLYQVCAATDAAYLPGAAFGLARIRARRRGATGQIADTGAVLAALDLVPTTSGGWRQSRQLAATYLTHAGQGVADLNRAAQAIATAGLGKAEQLRLELEVFRRALGLATLANRKAARRNTVPTVGGVPVTRSDLRAKIESILRAQASLEPDAIKRNSLLDQANSWRKWTLL